MKKFVIILCVAIALVQQTQAFKVVTIHKGAPPPAPAAPALDPAALLQGVQSAIAGKLQQVQTLVGSLVQQKTALKQNALNSIQSTLGSVKSQFGSLAGGAHPPLIIRKRVYVGVAKPAPAAPDSTTSVHADTTTTSA